MEATTSRLRRGGTNVCDHRHSRSVWSSHWRLPDGKRTHCSSDSTGGTAYSWGRGGRDIACRQPCAYFERHRVRIEGRAWKFKVQQAALSECAEDDVPVFE